MSLECHMKVSSQFTYALGLTHNESSELHETYKCSILTQLYEQAQYAMRVDYSH